ncbi:MAG TPA: DNA repair protein RadC [Methanolinea sp.]|nr:DNA repair protein RadC [Methanolinea sp.]HQK56365.1 DNA repair protein RadC [Methanolinea sp.]
MHAIFVVPPHMLPLRSQMKRMRELDRCDRPREKIANKGACSLSDQELIAAIIGNGTQGRDVFQVAREIAGLFRESADTISYDDLTAIRGVGEGKASQILASLELARRYLKKEEEARVKVQSPADILPLVAGLNGQRQEHFICITLNGAHEVIATRTITVGLLNHSLVHPREVFADAITDRAAAVICVHNHPSGTLEPSSQDLAVTRQLKDAGDLLGIRLLDHLIVARTGYLSLKERGDL